jgi:hypothetical protein
VTKQSKINKFLKEPLLHFLLIGLGLFFLYSYMNNGDTVDDNYIMITKADLEKIDASWVNNKGRIPTGEEKEKLLNDFILNEIFYREALAKGLDKNDATIHSHLAQKMKFVFNDLSPIEEPSDKQLQEFLSKNSELFIEPASISFNQVLFTSKNNSENIEQKANEFLQKLQNSKKSKKSTVGDLVELTKKGLNNLFDKEFVDNIFNVSTKSWQGPIKSKYGTHLVYIHSRNLSHIPKLSEIKEKVRQEWRKQKQKQVNEMFYKQLRNNYKVDIYNGDSK